VFHTTFDEPVARIAQQVTNGAALRVFLILPQHLSYTTFKRLDQRQVGSEIGLDDSAVSRALATLHKLEVIERKGKGPVTEWKLSPDFGWRGDVSAYHAEQRKRGAKAPGKGPAPDPLLPQKGYYGK